MKRCWIFRQNSSPACRTIVQMDIPLTTAVTQPGSSCELYSALEKNPSAKLIFAGHNHKNIVRSFASEGDNKLVEIQTGAFAQSNKNWRLIRLTKDQILVSFPGKMEIEIALSVK